MLGCVIRRCYAKEDLSSQALPLLALIDNPKGLWGDKERVCARYHISDQQLLSRRPHESAACVIISDCLAGQFCRRQKAGKRRIPKPPRPPRRGKTVVVE